LLGKSLSSSLCVDSESDGVRKNSLWRGGGSGGLSFWHNWSLLLGLRSWLGSRLGGTVIPRVRVWLQGKVGKLESWAGSSLVATIDVGRSGLVKENMSEVPSSSVRIEVTSDSTVVHGGVQHVGVMAWGVLPLVE